MKLFHFAIFSVNNKIESIEKFKIIKLTNMLGATGQFLTLTLSNRTNNDKIYQTECH